MLEKNGSIQTKIPDITDVWCEDNTFKPDELTNNSHEIVRLKCPNKSAKHPEYEIKVYNIQEGNCFSCPKCSVKTSKAEMRIYSELKSQFENVKWQQKNHPQKNNFHNHAARLQHPQPSKLYLILGRKMQKQFMID